VPERVAAANEPRQASILFMRMTRRAASGLQTILRHASYHVTLTNHFDPALKALEGQPPIDMPSLISWRRKAD
jgi:hypothetical protein